MKKGLFVVVEGCDGVGKSTLIKYLKKTTPPTDYYFSKDSALKSFKQKNTDPLSTLYMYSAIRLEELKSVKKLVYDHNKIVVYDRFMLSTEIYQGLGVSKKIKKVIKKTNQLVLTRSCIKPDIVFLVHNPNYDFIKNNFKNRGHIDHFEKNNLRAWRLYYKWYLKNKAKKNVIFINTQDTIEYNVNKMEKIIKRFIERP